MRLTGWTMTIAVCILGSPARGAAQRPDSVRSTLAGVYTADQARRGSDIYAGMCRSCHTTVTQTPTFRAVWSGRPLSELFEYISESMPQNSPGSLSPEENALVLAYVLRILEMPAGADALPSDPAALRKIRFDTVGARPSPDRDR